MFYSVPNLLSTQTVTAPSTVFVLVNTNISSIICSCIFPVLHFQRTLWKTRHSVHLPTKPKYHSTDNKKIINRFAAGQLHSHEDQKESRQSTVHSTIARLSISPRVRCSRLIFMWAFARVVILSRTGFMRLYRSFPAALCQLCGKLAIWLQ